MQKMITGAELKEWYNNHWPTVEGSPIDAFYHDGCDFDIESMPDDAMVELNKLGFVEYQGLGRDPRSRKDTSVKSYIQEWRKHRTYDFVLCRVPKENTQELLEFMKSIKATKV